MKDHRPIFISHAAKDEELVETFVDLLHVGIGIRPDQVFCSSLPGMGIPAGKNFVDYIRSHVVHPAKVILVISEEFLASQFCQHEVGASWGLELPVHPLLVPPVQYADARGTLAGIQFSKLDDREHLSDLRDDLIERLGLTPYPTSHWERKRDQFLTRLDTLLEAEPSSSGRRATAAHAISVVGSTGNWLKLGASYYEASRFERHGSTSIQVEIQAKNIDQEATLGQLRPSDEAYFFQESMAFAYQNDGGYVRIVKVSSSSREDATVWSLELVLEENSASYLHDMAYNFRNRQYTARDIAELRAGRLLINDPPPPNQRSNNIDERFLESLIAGDSQDSLRVDSCIVREAVLAHASEPDLRLLFARLDSVFALKTAGIVGTIRQLKIGPIDQEGVAVRFKGLRPARNRHEQSEEIEVSGTCRLEP